MGGLAGDLTSGHTPANSLAPLIAEVWEADTGVATASGAVTGWTGQVNGIVLAPTGALARPAFAADSTYFGGRSVVQCARTDDKLLTTGDLASPLFASGTRPYILIAARNRTNAAGGANHGWARFKTSVAVNTVNIGIEAYSDAADSQLAAPVRNNNVNVTVGDVLQDITVPCIAELVLTAGGASLYSDEALIATSAAGNTTASLSADCALFELGTNAFDASVGNVSLAMVVLCTAVPTAGQRAALRDYARRKWLE